LRDGDALGQFELLAKGSLHKQNTQAKKQQTSRNKLHIRTFKFWTILKSSTKMFEIKS
jgi:hypothetical protein